MRFKHVATILTFLSCKYSFKLLLVDLRAWVPLLKVSLFFKSFNAVNNYCDYFVLASVFFNVYRD